MLIALHMRCPPSLFVASSTLRRPRPAGDWQELDHRRARYRPPIRQGPSPPPATVGVYNPPRQDHGRDRLGADGRGAEPDTGLRRDEPGRGRAGLEDTERFRGAVGESRRLRDGEVREFAVGAGRGEGGAAQYQAGPGEAGGDVGDGELSVSVFSLLGQRPFFNSYIDTHGQTSFLRRYDINVDRRASEGSQDFVYDDLDHDGICWSPDGAKSKRPRKRRKIIGRGRVRAQILGSCSVVVTTLSGAGSKAFIDAVCRDPMRKAWIPQSKNNTGSAVFGRQCQ